jgi:hypothetical protein
MAALPMALVVPKAHPDILEKRKNDTITISYKRQKIYNIVVVLLLISRQFQVRSYCLFLGKHMSLSFCSGSKTHMAN